MKSKILSLLLILVMVFVITGCELKADDNSSQTSNVAVQEQQSQAAER